MSDQEKVVPHVMRAEPRSFDIAVIVLIAASNRIDDLRPLVPRIIEAFGAAKAGAVTLVEA